MKKQELLPKGSLVPWTVENSVCNYIDISYVELKSRRRILNLSNVLGAVAFFALILAPGAVEGENYILALVLIVIFRACAHISMREDGQIK